jgi:hypothetical protein
MPQIRQACKGNCKRVIRLSKSGARKYGGLCRPCFRAQHKKSRPITSRVKVRGVNIKPAKPQQQGRKGK